MSEQLELWHCDPVECVKMLIGNLAFKEFISYVAERVYRDDKRKVRGCGLATGDGKLRYEFSKREK